MAEEKIQKLSEGFDFIEESTSFSDESLSFQEADELVISESEGEKSPYKILGKACGCFAPIGEFSRNKRLYSDDLWPTVLANEEFSSRLNSRSIFGCISHSDKKVDDIDIREGKVSHIVSKLEIHEDANGKPFLYGELEILDTPAGRILEAMYKGGANLYVSSRGAGKLIPVPGQDYSMVKPDSYFVECFDVVCRPGFLKAKPVYEGIKEEQEVSEAQVDEEVKEHLPKGEKEDLLTTVYGAVNTKRMRKGKKMLSDEQLKKKETCESEEIQELKGQIDKLAKIIEKVVDDVYETEEPTNEDVQKQPIVEPKSDETSVEKTEEKGDEKAVKEALTDFVSLMADTNISEKAFEEIIDMIAKSKENK